MSAETSTGDSYHVPVLLSETLDLLVVNRYGTYADFTLGGGGHTAALLARLAPDARLLSFDADPGAIEHARQRFASESDGRLDVRQAYFTEACGMMEREGVKLAGALLDLGVSSRQLDTDQIGLSWRTDMRLDMRFRPDPERQSAAEMLNTIDPGELATLLRRYGDEPAAWTVAQAILRARPVSTTAQLRRTIEEVIPPPFQVKTLTRVFQALRIAVNGEMEELYRTLDVLTRSLLQPGGRIAVLTYHSLEDRLVKRFFRGDVIEETEGRRKKGRTEGRRHEVWPLVPVTRKPVEPSESEVERNPRARSARLRVAALEKEG